MSADDKTDNICSNWPFEGSNSQPNPLLQSIEVVARKPDFLHANIT